MEFRNRQLLVFLDFDSHKKLKLDFHQTADRSLLQVFGDARMNAQDESEFPRFRLEAPDPSLNLVDDAGLGLDETGSRTVLGRRSSIASPLLTSGAG